MTEGTSLDDLLNADISQEPEAVEAAPESASETPGRVRDENGRFAARTGVEPTAEPETEPQAEPVPPTDRLPQSEYKAIKEEREKRQAVEREIETLKAQLQSLQNPTEPPAPPPSIWEDEQAKFDHERQQAVRAAVSESRLEMSEMMMRQANPDFSANWDEMNRFLAGNPGLVEKCRQSPHPWNDAFTAFQNHRKMEELGAVNVADLEAKIREKVMAELQGNPAPQTSLPPTLTGERSVASRSGPAWSGPTPLSDLLR